MNAKSFPLTLACLLLLSCATATRAQQTPSGAMQNSPERRLSFFINGGNFLGVRTADVTRENMSRLNLSEMHGAVVTEVVQGSPAERAGLRKDDVIVRFDGDVVTSNRKLLRLIEEAVPETTVRLTVKRGGSEQEISATLGKRETLQGNNPYQLTIPQTGEFRRSLENLSRDGNGNFMIFSGNAARRIGVTTTPLTKQLADYFGVSGGEGLLITSVTENSPAAKAGLKAGDVITEADGKSLRTALDLSRIISRQTEGDVGLTIVREKASRNVRVTPERNANAEHQFNLTPMFETPQSR